jgi:hypothetical protein
MESYRSYPDGEGKQSLSYQLNDNNRDTDEIKPGRTIKIDTDELMLKFNWGDPISVNYAELFLNIMGADIPLMLQFNNEIILGREGGGKPGQTVLDLTSFEGDAKGVSRTHAALQRLKNNLYIVDLGSSNGTYVNGQRLSSHQPSILIEGDEIRLGNLVATISFKPTPAARR